MPVRRILGTFHASVQGVPLSGALKWDELLNADQIAGDEVDKEDAGSAVNAAMLGPAHRAVLLAPADDALEHRHCDAAKPR